MLPSRKQRRASGHRLVWKIVSAQYLTAAIVISQILIFFLSSKSSLFPGTDALTNTISSFAEIIAGLYGITMAGYTFFLSRIDAMTASDATLDFIVDSIKRRFKYLIWYITFSVIITLFTTLVLMYAPAPDQENLHYFYRLFCNEFILSVASSILLILYYSILVISPNCIEKEAAKLKKRISPTIGKPGDISSFFCLYDQIENTCNAMLPQVVLTQIHQNKGRQFIYTIRLLRETHPELRALLYDITRIHRYYECTVNCRDLSVSQDMCLLAEQILEELKKS